MLVGSWAPHCWAILQNRQDKAPKRSHKKRPIMKYLPGLSHDSKFVIKKPCYRIIVLIHNCFLTNLGVLFSINEWNVLIKYVSVIPYENIVKIYAYLFSERRRNCLSLWQAQPRYTVYNNRYQQPELLHRRPKSSMARSIPVENLLPQKVGSIINYLQ